MRANSVKHLSMLATAAVALVAASGCAREAGPDLTTAAAEPRLEASSEFLAAVSDRSGAEDYRYEASMTMGTGGASTLVSVASLTGEVDGDRTSMTIDMGDMFGAMGDDIPPELAGLDLTMDMVTDQEHVYVRAPFLAALADVAGVTSADQFGPFGAVLDLEGDTWARIDLASVPVGGPVADVTGGQNADPSVMLEAIAAGRDPHELGANTIRGVDVEGIGATITYGDLIATGGVDADDFAEQMRDQLPVDPGVDDEDLERGFDAMLDAEIEIEVWVDDDALVRQFVFELDMGSVIGEIGSAAGEPAPPGVVPTMRMAMDFFDYGDESIAVEIPADSVDVTDDLVGALGP